MQGNGIVTRRKGRARKSKGGSKQNAVGQYASDAWSLAKRTAVGLNEIRKLINIETKFLDVVTNAASINTTGGTYCVSQLAQGLTSTTRVGDSLRIQHLELRGRVVANGSATSSCFRVLMFRDLDGYGTLPTMADVLEYNAVVDAPRSPYKYNKLQRFSILFDELIEIQTSTGVSSVPFTFSTAHQGHVLYLGTSAAAASNGKGSVYMGFVSDEATNTPTVSFTSRMTFTDD